MTPTGPQEKEVTLGLFNDKMVEVRDGLTEGDDVILNPKVLLGDAAKTRDDRPSPGGPPRRQRQGRPHREGR